MGKDICIAIFVLLSSIGLLKVIHVGFDAIMWFLDIDRKVMNLEMNSMILWREIEVLKTK